jgi:hypothetical protein
MVDWKHPLYKSVKYKSQDNNEDTILKRQREEEHQNHKRGEKTAEKHRETEL